MTDLDGYYSFDEDDLINDNVQEDDYQQQEEYPEDSVETAVEQNKNEKTETTAIQKPQPSIHTIEKNTIVATTKEVFVNNNNSVNNKNKEDDNIFSTSHNDISKEVEVVRNKNKNTSKKSKTKKQRKLFDNLDRFTGRYEWRTNTNTDENDEPLVDTATTWKKKNKIKKLEADCELVQYLLKQQHSSVLSMKQQKVKKNDRYMVRDGDNRSVEGSDVAVTLSNGDRIHIPQRTNVLSNMKGTGRNYFASSLGRLQQRSSLIMNSLTPSTSNSSTKKSIISCSDLWVDKYSPHHFLHLLSNEKINRDVLRALREWDPYVFKRKAPPKSSYVSYQQQQQQQQSNNNMTGESSSTGTSNMDKGNDTRPEASKRVILLTGPPGIGKTTLAHIVSKHAGYHPIEINASLDRSTSLISLLSRSMSSNTLLTRKPNSIILDEVDGLDSSTLKPLIQMFKKDSPKIQRPIILIANNKYASVLRPLLPYVHSFHVNAPETNRLVSRCKHILSQETLCINHTQLLYQLVDSANNDIRSCLFTLQFVSSAARASSSSNKKKVVDLSHYLTMDDATTNTKSSMWKDDRMDVITILKTIFRKNKSLEMVKFLLDGGVSDISKLLDSCFLNVPYMPFIDPNMNKLYTACDWLSCGDLYRSFKSSLASNHPSDFILLQKWYIPVILSAIHSLCRTSSSNSQLIYSTKELHDLYYTKEAHNALLHRFMDGLPVANCTASSSRSTLLDVIPYMLYFMKAGEGKYNIHRGVSAYEFYTKDEMIAFDIRMNLLKGLNLTYVSVEDEDECVSIRLEPEIDQLMAFKDLEYLGGVRDIPPTVKQLLAHTAHLERMKEQQKILLSKNTTLATKPKEIPQEIEKEKQIAITPKPKESPNKTTVITNKPKVESFLTRGAAKSKALKNKRKASSCIGYNNNTQNKKNKTKLSHTGSGNPLNQVIKFKYQKGYTQAVRIPCRIEDLI